VLSYRFPVDPTQSQVINEWHYGANHGTEPVEMIAFCAGVKGQPITIPQK
jgi:hypothetical protein